MSVYASRLCNLLRRNSHVKKTRGDTQTCSFSTIYRLTHILSLSRFAHYKHPSLRLLILRYYSVIKFFSSSAVRKRTQEMAKKKRARLCKVLETAENMVSFGAVHFCGTSDEKKLNQQHRTICILRRIRHDQWLPFCLPESTYNIFFWS